MRRDRAMPERQSIDMSPGWQAHSLVAADAGAIRFADLGRLGDEAAILKNSFAADYADEHGSRSSVCGATAVHQVAGPKAAKTSCKSALVRVIRAIRG